MRLIADIDILRHHASVGPVASDPTVWRALEEAAPAAMQRVDQARAKVRRHVWAPLARPGPASRVAGTDLGETIVMDIDATMVTVHSEKEQAAGTFKGDLGSIRSACGATTPASRWRSCCGPGNAGSVRHEVARDEWTHRLEVRRCRRCSSGPVSRARPRPDVRRR